jgi:hypothetical protein
MQPNLLKANGHIFQNAERASEIKIAFHANCRVAQRNPEGSCNRPQGDACASNQRFEQHVCGTCALPIATGRRV